MDWQPQSANHESAVPELRKISSAQRAFGPNGFHGSIIVPTFLSGALACFLGLALDYFLIHQERFRPFTASLILNVAFGIVAAVLVHRLLAHEREKHQRVLQRLAVIDEMNHHIRNALQVIAFNTATSSTGREVTEITQAVDRIQWSLCEILPRVEPEFTPFEGSVRKNAGPVVVRADEKKSH